MIPTKQYIIDLYRKRARRYDFTANLYYLMGFREWNYRERAIAALRLEPGDTVVEIGCGTGLNFPLLQKVVGPKGKIIGLDLTDRMLEEAKRRVEKHQWANVQLIQVDASEYNFPENLAGVISTFALTLMPDYDLIIKKGSKALAPGGRMVALDFKKPAGLNLGIAKFAMFLTRPFGVSLDLADRHPWESIERYFDYSDLEDVYFGFSYIAMGGKKDRLSESIEKVNLTDFRETT